MFYPSIAIVGAGKAGTAFGAAFAAKGCRICGVASRSLASAKELANRFGAAASNRPAEVTAGAEIVLITTPDACILETVRGITGLGGFTKGQFVYHSSGALGSDVLLSAKQCGAFIGCIHPLQTLAGGAADKEYLENCYFAVDGDKEASETAKRLVGLLGGTTLFIPAEKRAIYHAAATTASNYLVALLHAAGNMLQEAGVKEGSQVLMPLITATLKNIENQGTLAALTGPISRGDTCTVARHLLALKETKEADLYAALARYTTAMAREKGTLSGEQAEEILKITERLRGEGL